MRDIVRNVEVWDREAARYVRIDADLEIDTHAVACELARKAYNNKSRRSSMMDGLIEVRMRGTKAEPVP